MFGDTLRELRKRFGYTQEELAGTFEVSRQAIQKWESGTSLPDTLNVIRIASYFNVSVDYLLRGADTRPVEALRASPVPDYCRIPHWEAYSYQLDVEYTQSFEEGADIGKLHGLFEAAESLEQSAEKETIADVLYTLIRKAGMREGYRYTEPDSIEGIRELRHSFELNPAPVPDAAVLSQKLRGAWLGRICGCLLGKPIEGIRRRELLTLLKDTGNYPLHRYIKRDELTEELLGKLTFGLRDREGYTDRLHGAAPWDDDTNYTVMASRIIERYGRDFTSDDIREAWMELQPKTSYCTAERVAYRNFILGYRPHDTATYKNPYREWIGAQIRGDYFGYINPGAPETAAEMAWRDASVSHVKNGIYGEMWVAAMLACAAASESIPDILLGGLEQIPETSRLYESVYGIYTDWKNGVTATEAFAKINGTYDDTDKHHWCHTISNACIVAAALLYGEGDYSRSVCMAVGEGFDTDCNGATVGSVVGMAKGVNAISGEWSAPVGDTLETTVFGVGNVNVKDLVDITLRHAGY